MNRLFGRRNRRRTPAEPGPRRLTPGVIRSAIVATVALVVGVSIGPTVLEHARRHPYFAVRAIDVRHRGRLDAVALRSALGVTEGDSIWDLDARAAEARLRERTWVRSATVRRQLPDRIVVQVREYRPAAIVSVVDPEPTLFYVAANGRIFAPVGPTDGRDLPYITGLSREDLDGLQGFGPQAVHRALGLLRTVARAAPGLGSVSEVHVDRVAGLTLLPVRPAVPIELGWGRFVLKVERLGRVLPLWIGREADVRGVSCVFDNEVIVRTAAPRAKTPVRGAAGA